MTVAKRSGYTPQGAAATELILEIFRANGRAMRAGDGLARDFDLTAARWQVMGAIADQPKTVAHIAQSYELSRQGVRWVVAVLEESGLVEQVDNPNHRRAKLVRLTPAGETSFQRIVERQTVWVNALSAPFAASELRQAIDVLKRFASGM